MTETEDLRRLLREFCLLWAQASLLGADEFRAAYHRFDRELRERGILPKVDEAKQVTL